MKSRAQFQSHPIHPALIPFPFAFLTGAAFFDVIGVMPRRPSLLDYRRTPQVAGIACGLLAAIPGADRLRLHRSTASSAKKRATRHALGNVSAFVLFAVAWLSRGAGWQPGRSPSRSKSSAPALLAYSGYLGGTLVTRNMISVDHRYASAGKWQEAEFTADAAARSPSAMLDDLEVRADEAPARQRSPHRARANVTRVRRVRRSLYAPRRLARRRRAHRRHGSLPLARVAVRLRDRAAVTCGPAKAAIRRVRGDGDEGRAAVARFATGMTYFSAV